MVLRCFLPNVPQFGKRCHIFTGRAPQSKNYGALQDSTLSGIASKYGAHRRLSAAHGARRMVHRANRCHCGTFVASFLTCTVYTFPLCMYVHIILEIIKQKVYCP